MVRFRLCVFGIAIAIVPLAGGCAAELGQPQAELSTTRSPLEKAAIRQTDDAGNRLPFDTDFPNRWSGNNDGTTYEPCTQVPFEVVDHFGLDRQSIADVAASDHQTARGCEWRFANDPRSTLAQFVGNLVRPSAGLSGHKELNRAGTTWLPDASIAGRRVLRESAMPGDCAVYVQSGTALVITTVTRMGLNPPPSERVCGEALDFLRATINQIPS
ncbi:hypothetical protein ACN94_15400 [Gordonia paraffinivorans]|uniref:DUF3558 family protein n=1 Tax=Gordonia paraffinivorans TaxID=175628 RepID=UPI000D61EB89|nr:DUF3558 family protein [Gordonia paraffinivorans]MBY4574954.1 hypothetical protein [Gordonia paraffinivorans]PWD44979.1 hypothetical protein ACN93_00735 [Gordonia paraffinivorans]